MRRRPAGSLFALALTLAACETLEPVAEQERELDSRREQWRQRGFRDYSYRLRVVCYCALEVTREVSIDVVNDSIASLSYVDTGEPVDTAFAALFPTVDGLFDRIQNAIVVAADSIDARYDPALHYPVSITIDYHREIADDELGYRAAGMRPLAADSAAGGR